MKSFVSILNRRRSKRILLGFFGFSIVCLLAVINVLAQEKQTRVLLPIGGGHLAGYDCLVLEAANLAGKENDINILILPISLATDPYKISDTERTNLHNSTEEYAQSIEAACDRVLPEELNCIVMVVPIFTRSDAQDDETLKYFTRQLSTIYIPDGDQAVAMQVIADTPIESALIDLYHKGTIIAGNGAGANLQSSKMIAGYHPGYSVESAFVFGAVDVWTGSPERGLLVGLKNAIIDQHFFQENNVGRLLNAITLPELPHIGIGLNDNTSLKILDGELINRISGLDHVTILDAETYHAADTIQYTELKNLISVRNILFHYLTPNNQIFNLQTRETSLAPPHPLVNRAFNEIVLPDNAGVLFLGGDISDDLDNNIALSRFVNLSGGESAVILVIAAGYETPEIAQSMIELYGSALGIPYSSLIMDNNTGISLDYAADHTGILVISDDLSTVLPQLLLPVKEAWLTGTPLFTDDAAISLMGEKYSLPSPDIEKINQSNIEDLQFRSGLGLIGANFEPQLLADNRWRNLFSLVSNYPDYVTFGLTKNTVLEIGHSGTTIRGENVVLSLDARTADIYTDSDQLVSISNGLIDIFTPGDLLAPQNAIMDTDPIPVATPILSSEVTTLEPIFTVTPPPTITPTPMPTDIITEVVEVKASPTRGPKPTATPVTIPPPQNISSTNLMIGLMVIAVIVVLIGLWINRKRLRIQ